MSLVSMSSFSSRKQFTNLPSFFPSFIALILKLFLLERSWRFTSLFSISIDQLGLVVGMTSMSFFRLNRFLSVVDIFSVNLLDFSNSFSLVLCFLKLIALCCLRGFWTFPAVFCDSFLMLFEHILEDLFDIFIGKFPWADGWLLVWWLFIETIFPSKDTYKQKQKRLASPLNSSYSNKSRYQIYFETLISNFWTKFTRLGICVRKHQK